MTIPPLDDQPQLEEELPLLLRPAEGLEEAVLAGEGIPEAEPLPGLSADPPPLEVTAGSSSGRSLQVPLEGRGRPLIDLPELGEPGVGRALSERGELHPCLPGQSLHGLPEGEPLDLHQEFEDVPALAAAEAVEQLPLRVDRQAGALVGMEGADGDPVLPAPLQGEVAGEDLDHIDPVADQL